MSRAFPRITQTQVWTWTLVVALAAGWAAREVAHAREKASTLKSEVVNLAEVPIKPFEYEGKKVGTIGVYVSGDTPSSSKFVTGRFVLDAGETPHKPHVHEEEEVMIVASGNGEIVCDGVTSKVGPGSVMFTTPNAPHGIVNTGKDPLLFYFIKWAPASK